MSVPAAACGDLVAGRQARTKILNVAGADRATLDAPGVVTAATRLLFPAGDDTWTDTPFADGVVLVGDAAGYNDPIVGQGLSIALRDARIVRDLILDGARQPADFAPYGRERSERMRRLRLIADVVSVTFAEDADNRVARRAFLGEKMASMDAEVFPLLVGFMTGPETIPGQLVHPEILDRIRDA